MKDVLVTKSHTRPVHHPFYILTRKTGITDWLYIHYCKHIVGFTESIQPSCVRKCFFN